jgi:preprotein translocase subunit SecD
MHYRQYRAFYSLVGIAVITLLALLIAVSGTGLFTLHLGRPVTVQLGLDLQGGARILLQAMPAPGQALDDETMEATQRIIESRVNGGLGVTEPVIQTVKSGDKRFISVELPGLKKNLQNVESVLQKTGQMLTCGILWWFGSTFAASIIVGFATTLFIGVVLSMLTAVLVSRTFLHLALADASPTRRALFGAGF